MWLDKDVKRLIEDENLNLTKWVNDNVLLSLALDTPEKVEAKIRLKESELEVLKKRLERLTTAEAESGKVESGQSDALEELQEAYAIRCRKGLERSNNINWITSPRNILRCRVLKQTAEEVLTGLEVWYDGTQASK